MNRGLEKLSVKRGMNIVITMVLVIFIIVIIPVNIISKTMNRGLEKFALGEEGMKRRSRGAAGAKTGTTKK